MIVYLEATKPKIKPGDVWRVQYRGLVRMLLFFTGRTHTLLSDMSTEMGRTIVQRAGSDGLLDGLAHFRVKSALVTLWQDTYKEWKREFELLRTEAVSLAIGGLCALHEGLVRPALAEINEAVFEEVADPIFNRWIQELLTAANRRAYDDGLKLSQRIWNLDRKSRAGIGNVIDNGVARGRSAYDMGRDLESYLGVSADCPRWTRTRLRLTKTEIAAGDVAGLKSGEDCRGQGVAYNALRLARNELQVIHGMATDAMMAKLPFVEREQIVLSPSHPRVDECDGVVAGGDDGDGTYPKGTIDLPLHISCLCIKLAVLMDTDDFVDRLRGWQAGTQAWPEMDDYGDGIGGINQSLAGAAVLASLVLWSSGKSSAMQDVLE